MDVISHPFRLAAGGQVATVTDGTTAANTEAVAVTALTRPGERVLVPDFGVPDATFSGDLAVADLAACIDLFGPDGVTIADVAVAPAADGLFVAVIEFDEDGDDLL